MKRFLLFVSILFISFGVLTQCADPAGKSVVEEDAIEAERQRQEKEAKKVARQNLLNSGVVVNLGLPSKTLWYVKNEGGDYARYTYDEAVNKFGNKLPTKEQLEELKNQCIWIWMGSGYKVVGPNGNSIYLPAAGHRDYIGTVLYVGSNGYYWSSTPHWSSGFVYFLFFNSGEVDMNYNFSSLGRSVRLVQD